MTLTLRPYQTAAIDAFFAWNAANEGHGLVVMPTGSGKSATMAATAARAIANAPDTRVLVLAHRKELISQNVRAMATAMPLGSIGVYSAGLRRRDRDHQVIVAGIQSIGRDPYAIGAFDLILIDECHLLPPTDDTLYRKFIKAALIQNPNVRFGGYTATPFRLGAGLLHRGKNPLFTDIVYEAPVRDLIDQGYLCRLISKATAMRLDTRGIAIRGGEYVSKALEDAVDRDGITRSVVEETLTLAHDRQKILVFCVGVAHAEHVAAAFAAEGVASAAVHGELDDETRTHRLVAFREGRLRLLTSVDVLSVGYDEPSISCIVLLRPTKSTGLYIQQVGRGFRLHPSKENTLVLDYADLVSRFGPVDAIRVEEAAQSKGEGQAPTKVCPECHEIVFAGAMACGVCGHAFPPPERPPILPTASTAPILSDEAVPITWHDVTDVTYAHHTPKPPKTTPTLRVDYHAGLRRIASEWICLEHEGFARSKAESWWRARSPDDVPDTIEDALTLTHALRVPVRIATRPQRGNPKFTEVCEWEFERRVARSCETCAFFREGLLIGDANTCTKWEAEPPEGVQAVGCEAWELGARQMANARADAALAGDDDELSDLPF